MDSSHVSHTDLGRGCVLFVLLAVFQTVLPLEAVTECPVYVTEGMRFYCECLAVNVGKTNVLPVATWPGHSDNYQLFIPEIRRHDNGTVYTCQITVGSEVKRATYVLQVAYGPTDETTRILGPDTFITDGDGSRNLTLTCEATEVNPAPSYSWSGVACYQGNQGSTCTFSPRPPADDGRRVACTATNRFTSPDSTTGTAETRVRLTYKASVRDFRINNSSVELTVQEGGTEHVLLVCQAGGAPPPLISFHKQGETTALRSTRGSSLSFQFAVSCDKMGTYTCTADNGYPNPGHLSVSLIVNSATQPPVHPKHTDAPSQAGIVGGVVGALALLAVIVAVGIYLWKRDRPT